jgi:hypothetical protein
MSIGIAANLHQSNCEVTVKWRNGVCQERIVPETVSKPRASQWYSLHVTSDFSDYLLEYYR